MIKMSIRIDLVEDESGRTRSRVSAGVDTLTVPTYAILDHMLRKMDTMLAQAKVELIEQCKLQNLPYTEEVPL